MKKLLIRVETIDGDVDYYEPTEDLCYYLEFQGIKVDQCAVARKFYPEFRVNDLLIIFSFFEVGDTRCDDTRCDDTRCDTWCGATKAEWTELYESASCEDEV